MLLKRNLLENITIISCSGTIICILLNYVTNISPITGIWYPIYIFFVFIVSVSFSFRFIQWLLHLNRPIKYDVDGLSKNYPYLSYVFGTLPQPRQREVLECKEYDTNELSVISTVLERRLVSSWYVPYISQEIGFPFACKQMLDHMIGRTFQICNKIETKDVYVDICSILISHLKEYKKALKRHEKTPETTLESLYKMTHPINNDCDKKYQSADHCTNILRIVLKELVAWELWDTPHSELLVRILAKKLDNFIENTLANPIWLNDKLLSIIKGKEPEKDIRQDKEQKEEKVDDKVQEEIKEEVKTDKVEIQTEKEMPKLEPTTIESALSTVITKSTAPILLRDITEDLDTGVVTNGKLDDVLEETALNLSEPVDIKSSPVLRQRRGRQGMNEVKIYDRVIEGSVKTWDTDIDLQCISLGQDLLASLNGEITLSRLWGQDPAEPDTGRSEQQPLWFGEEDTLEMELSDSKEPSPVRKEASPKPTDLLLKDLQTTVHQAKAKIGDLQVASHVIRVPNNDEAAGMMEGLLDFGIAGLKKGLRFTGLGDDSLEKSPSYHKERSGEKSSPPAEPRSKPGVEQREGAPSSVLQREDNGIASVPPLVKQHRVASQDSVLSLPKLILKDGPPPPLAGVPDSPEPEYEEAADLSTSIAKLRCLLQQRAEASPRRAEEIWWEGAQETRGRTHHHHHRSSRPIDTATLADEYDMNAERASPPGQSSNNMQRLDKLFHRTVTGVFNSIKTAVGAEGEMGGAAGGPRPSHDWTYVCSSIELSVGGAVARLVGSRRAFNHVDAALDSLDQLRAPPRDHLAPEDFEEWCAVSGAGWCAGGELACAAGVCRSHVAYRLATLLCADLAESLIDIYLDELTAWLRRQVFVLFEELAKQQDSINPKEEGLREFDLEETSAAVVARIPVLQIFGEETLTEAVKLTISSFSHKEVNRDVVYRALDLFAIHFKKSAGLRNPSFDAN